MKRANSVFDWESEYFCILNKNNEFECLICDFASNRKFNCERHYRTKHSTDFNKENATQKRSLFDNMKINFTTTSLSTSDEINMQHSSLKASYIISYNIAKSKKPFVEGEFLKRNFEEALKCFGHTCEKSLECISSINLSRSTVSRRIIDLSSYVSSKLKDLLADCKYFSIALDESTDLSDTSQLLIFARMVFENFTTHEEMLSCVPLHRTTKGIDIFRAVEQKIIEFGNINKLSGVCTDGAASMVGKFNGLKGIMKKNNIDVPFYHCAIHQESLCAKSFNIKSTMDTVIKIVNKLKGGQNSLTHRELKNFLKETESTYEDVILFTQVRWLSRGNCLNRFFILRKDILAFMETRISETENVKLLISRLKCKEFITSLAFMNDMLTHLNSLNLNLQGKNHSVFRVLGNIDGFKLKLEIFKTSLENNNLAYFKSCFAVLEQFPDFNFSKFVPEIKILIQQFNERFVDFENIRRISEIFGNPIHCTIANQPTDFQLELCDLQTDIILKNSKETGMDFWKLVSPSRFPNLVEAIIKQYSLFSSTYTCESTFSHMTMIKNQYRNRLSDEQLENLLRLSTTAIEIDFDILANK